MGTSLAIPYFILFVALANLYLGYAVAVYAGWGPKLAQRRASKAAAQTITQTAHANDLIENVRTPDSLPDDEHLAATEQPVTPDGSQDHSETSAESNPNKHVAPAELPAEDPEISKLLADVKASAEPFLDSSASQSDPTTSTAPTLSDDVANLVAAIPTTPDAPIESPETDIANMVASALDSEPIMDSDARSLVNDTPPDSQPESSDSHDLTVSEMDAVMAALSAIEEEPIPEDQVQFSTMSAADEANVRDAVMAALNEVEDDKSASDEGPVGIVRITDEDISNPIEVVVPSFENSCDPPLDDAALQAVMNALNADVSNDNAPMELTEISTTESGVDPSAESQDATISPEEATAATFDAVMQALQEDSADNDAPIEMTEISTLQEAAAPVPPVGTETLSPEQASAATLDAVLQALDEVEE